jgi:hypothetical protein
MTTRFFTRTINETTKTTNQPSSPTTSCYDDLNGKKWNVNNSTTSNRLFWNTINYSTNYNGHLLTNRSLFNDDSYNTTMVRTIDSTVCKSINNNNSPMILACSVSSAPTFGHYYGSRTLCCDRKGWVDHLYPQPLTKNVSSECCSKK